MHNKMVCLLWTKHNNDIIDKDPGEKTRIEIIKFYNPSTYGQDLLMVYKRNIQFHGHSPCFLYAECREINCYVIFKMNMEN